MVLVQSLLKRGADPNYRDNQNRSPIFYLSSSEGSAELLKEFINADANVQLIDIKGRTPLHLFVQKNNETLVKRNRAINPI